MNNQFITNILIVILVAVFGVLLFNHFPVTDVDRSDDVDLFSPEEIIAAFSYSGGLHEYTGSIDFPNGCYSLTKAEALVMESYPEQVVLVFEADDGPAGAFCTQAIKTEEFRIIFGASDQATVSATYNGDVVDLLVVQQDALDLVEFSPVDGEELPDEPINPVVE